jgi:hypothetical protein
MKPTLAMAEYASMRSRLVCAMAMRLPATTDRVASTASIWVQLALCMPSPSARNRNAMANEAILGTVATSVAELAGAPW